MPQKATVTVADDKSNAEDIGTVWSPTAARNKDKEHPDFGAKDDHSQDSIVVAVRVRPFNAREISQKEKCCIAMSPRKVIVTPSADQRNSIRETEFEFPFCYWSHKEDDPTFVSQYDVFHDLGLLYVQNALAGYNSTVFAYGQTGAGKTYSMLGSGVDPGLIPRGCRELFKRITSEPNPLVGYEVEASFLEIYNEKARDLLPRTLFVGNNANQQTKAISAVLKDMETLPVREHPEKGFYVENLTKHRVSNLQDIMRLMALGQEIRTTAATQMNQVSSRSHSIFIITIITTTQPDPAKLKNPTGRTSDLEARVVESKINLVDLAGSEKVKKTGSTGARFEEAKNINQSLSTLGNVISALASGAPHVPYRDSVLTKLLQESLGGNAKTIMLAAISPAAYNVEETISTLRYAKRVTKIKNVATVNETDKGAYERELEAQVAKLKSELEGKKSGIDSAEQDRLLAELEHREAQLQRMRMSHEERLAEMKQYEDKRRQRLAELGICFSADDSLPEGNVPRLLNLSSNPQLAKTVVFFLSNGINRAGTDTAQTKQDIMLEPCKGNIFPEHAVFTVERAGIKPQADGATAPEGQVAQPTGATEVVSTEVYVRSANPYNEGIRIYINGEALLKQQPGDNDSLGVESFDSVKGQKLFHGDRVILGQDYIFQFVHPDGAGQAGAQDTSLIEWELHAKGKLAEKDVELKKMQEKLREADVVVDVGKNVLTQVRAVYKDLMMRVQVLTKVVSEVNSMCGELRNYTHCSLASKPYFTLEGNCPSYVLCVHTVSIIASKGWKVETEFSEKLMLAKNGLLQDMRTWHKAKLDDKSKKKAKPKKETKKGSTSNREFEESTATSPKSRPGSPKSKRSPFVPPPAEFRATVGEALVKVDEEHPLSREFFVPIISGRAGQDELLASLDGPSSLQDEKESRQSIGTVAVTVQCVVDGKALKNLAQLEKIHQKAMGGKAEPGSAPPSRPGSGSTSRPGSGSTSRPASATSGAAAAKKDPEIDFKVKIGVISLVSPQTGAHCSYTLIGKDVITTTPGKKSHVTSFRVHARECTKELCSFLRDDGFLLQVWADPMIDETTATFLALLKSEHDELEAGKARKVELEQALGKLQEQATQSESSTKEQSEIRKDLKAQKAQIAKMQEERKMMETVMSLHGLNENGEMIGGKGDITLMLKDLKEQLLSQQAQMQNDVGKNDVLAMLENLKKDLLGVKDNKNDDAAAAAAAAEMVNAVMHEAEQNEVNKRAAVMEMEELKKQAARELESHKEKLRQETIEGIRAKEDEIARLRAQLDKSKEEDVARLKAEIDKAKAEHESQLQKQKEEQAMKELEKTLQNTLKSAQDEVAKKEQEIAKKEAEVAEALRKKEEEVAKLADVLKQKDLNHVEQEKALLEYQRALTEQQTQKAQKEEELAKVKEANKSKEEETKRLKEEIMKAKALQQSDMKSMAEKDAKIAEFLAVIKTLEQTKEQLAGRDTVIENVTKEALKAKEDQIAQLNRDMEKKMAEMAEREKEAKRREMEAYEREADAKRREMEARKALQDKLNEKPKKSSLCVVQ